MSNNCRGGPPWPPIGWKTVIDANNHLHSLIMYNPRDAALPRLRYVAATRRL
jgi:hypothetical protein